MALFSETILCFSDYPSPSYRNDTEPAQCRDHAIDFDLHFGISKRILLESHLRTRRIRVLKRATRDRGLILFATLPINHADVLEPTPVAHSTQLIIGCLIVLFVLINHPSRAQLPGGILEEKIQRLLDTERRGVIEDLSTSEAVLYWYPDLLPIFEESLRAVREAKELEQHFTENPPHSPAHWGQYLQSFLDVQLGREKYISALRDRIAYRQPILENLLTRGLVRGFQELDEAVSERQRDLEILIAIEEQLIDQKQSIMAGDLPHITWRNELSTDLASELEQKIDDVINAGEASDRWQLLRRLVRRIRRDVEESMVHLRAAAESNWAQLDDLHRRTLAELNVLSEAQIDVFINSLLQEAAIRRLAFSRYTYEVWRLRKQ